MVSAVQVSTYVQMFPIEFLSYLCSFVFLGILHVIVCSLNLGTLVTFSSAACGECNQEFPPPFSLVPMVQNCKLKLLRSIDVGTGGHWGHVPLQEFAINKEVPFYF